jgi:transglutaminase-like putative cysteine protease
MRIRAGYEITYECPQPTPMLLLLNVHASRYQDLETPDVVRTNPFMPVEQYHDGFGNLCSRIVCPPGRTVISPDAIQHPVEDLPHEVIVFLLASRYCETEHLSDLAWKLFGDVTPGWARAQAIVEYTHNRITFGYQHARPTKTAFEAHEEQLGVCRDYAHLAISLCRCMNIPARYCTGYLPDIGVPLVGEMDFSAWFEVYLGGKWRILDARHNKPRIGRILMARGRDATDAAITTSFGPNLLAGFKVIGEELR